MRFYSMRISSTLVSAVWLTISFNSLMLHLFGKLMFFVLLILVFNLINFVYFCIFFELVERITYLDRVNRWRCLNFASSSIFAIFHLLIFWTGIYNDRLPLLLNEMFLPILSNW